MGEGFWHFREAVHIARHNVLAINEILDEYVSSIDHYETAGFAEYSGNGLSPQ